MDAVVSDSVAVLAFDIQWDAVVHGTTAASRTEGALDVRVNGSSVWSTDGDAVRWTWIEMVEWLSLNWASLQLEDGLPFSVEPQTVDDLERHVNRQAAYVSAPVSDDLQVRLWEFLECHDLSRSLQGALYKPLVIWREGLLGHILTDTRHVTAEWEQIDAALRELGANIVGRLRSFTSEDGRASSAMRAWDSRSVISSERALEIASGITNSRLARVSESLGPEFSWPWVSDWSRIEGDELLAVARMSAALPDDAITVLLRNLQTMVRSSTNVIDQAASQVQAAALSGGGLKPYEEGYAAAAAFRALAALDESRPFRPQDWLEKAGVQYQEIAVPNEAIDALACWGENRGPAILVNRRGRHARSPGGRNASVAHEICHLLLDREGALPVAEVLGGRVNPSVEARARAFAAELLLPRSRAGRLAEAQDVQHAEQIVRSLMARYRVSREIVAWQARNSSAQLPEEIREYLRSLVGMQANF